MCGIFGTFGRDDLGEVDAGLDRLAHRGPDGRGVARAGEAIHGHVRLSLVDLTDASAQPFVLPGTNGGVLSFVGEVWNHRELRTGLEAVGERFTSAGDTEVLARALRRWGVDGTLNDPEGLEVDGMFTFAWSSRDGDWLVRDRFGKVPLYVLRQGLTFTWASERKAFGGTLGGSALALPPGTSLDLRTGEVRPWCSQLGPGGGPDADVLEMLRTGTRRRLEADAPTCCLISGGLDSSILLALAAEVRPDVEAFTAVLDPASEDLRTARRLCSELDVRLHEVAVPEPTADLLAEAVACIEIGSKAQAEIAVACLPLARAVASHGFKACLSGEAADELFGGYGNSCIRAASLNDLGWRVHRRQLLEKMSRGNFVRCNKTFMAAGVECRLPFMERSLVEHALSLGKRACPPGKGLLKEAARPLLPRWVVDREKDTFQGGSGVSAAIARVVGDPLHFVHAEVRRRHGKLTME